MRFPPPSAPLSADSPELLPAVLQAMEQASNAVLITRGANDDHRIVYANPAMCEMSGYAAHELLGSNARMLQGAQTSSEVIAELRSCLAEGRFFRGSTYNYRKDGTPYLLEWNISPVRDGSGCITHFVSTQHDLSALATAQASTDIFARALDATSDGVLICSQHGLIEFANQGYEKITGLRASDLIGRERAAVRSGGHDPAVHAALWARLKGGHPVREVFIHLRADGTQVHCEESSSPLRNRQSQITHYVSIARDVTARVLSERAFREQMQRDSLTGTLTRTSGSLHLEDAVAQARALGMPLALALVDVDKFKQVNDRFGHATGDKALASVAHALTACLRAGDRIIRWGGEEFLLVMPGCDLAGAVATLERCRHAVRTAGAQLLALPITISAGVGMLQPGQDLAPAIERIDQLLYRAKEEGRDQVRVVDADRH